MASMPREPIDRALFIPPILTNFDDSMAETWPGESFGAPTEISGGCEQSLASLLSAGMVAAGSDFPAGMGNIMPHVLQSSNLNRVASKRLHSVKMVFKSFRFNAFRSRLYTRVIDIHPFREWVK